jgi:hypothetical protein
MKAILITLFLLMFVFTGYSKCYDICPDTISLNGTIQIDTVIHEQCMKCEDKIELFWILNLSNEICAKIKNENESEKADRMFKQIQLMIRQDYSNGLHKYLKNKVKIKGILYQSVDERNISILLMNVVSVHKINY